MSCPAENQNPYQLIESKVLKMLMQIDEEDRQFALLDQRLTQFLDRGQHNPQTVSALLSCVKSLDASMSEVKDRLSALFSSLLTLREQNWDPSGISQLEAALAQNKQALSESRRQMVRIQHLLNFIERTDEDDQPIAPFSHKREPFWGSDPRLFWEKPQPEESRRFPLHRRMYIS